MRSKIIVSVLFLINIAAFAGGTNELKIPESGWYVNNFRKAGCGAKLSYEKTPDGGNAIIADFFGNATVNLIMPFKATKKQAEQWPKEFNGLKGYFWNDGKLTTLAITFRTSEKQSYTAFLKMNHKGWKIINIPSVTNFRDRSKQLKLHPDKITSLMFRLYKRFDAKIGVGALTWETPGVKLHKLDTGNSAAIFPAAKPPALDGKLDDPIWKSAKPVTLDYLALNQGKSDGKNWFKAAYDKDNFYIAAKMPFKAGTKLKSDLTDFDSALWNNEDFEFFLLSDSYPDTYYQFLVNPAGTKADIARIFDQVDDRVKNKYKDWNGKWQVKTAKGKDYWTVEAAVPWETIGADKIPEVVQFQAMRTDKTGKAIKNPIWSPVRRRPTEGFGILNLTDGAGQVKINNLSLKRIKNGEVNISGTVNCTNPVGEVLLKAWYADELTPPKTFTRKLKIDGCNGSFSWNINIGSSVNGYHQVTVRATPVNRKFAGGVAVYHFSQHLPAKIGFADVCLNPVPKKMKLGKGGFMPKPGDVITVSANASERTVKTAKFMAEKLYGIYGVKPKIVKGGTGRITVCIDTAAVTKKIPAESPEAYLLKVTSDRIEITGGGEAGLYYGVVTLSQLAASPKLPNVPVRTANIIDWPTYKKRIVSIIEMGHCKKNNGGTHGYEVAVIKDWIKRYVAGNKFNVMIFGFADNVNYPSRPDLHHKDNFTAEDIKDIFDFAREHFIDIAPGITYGAHSGFWIRHYRNLAEKHYRAQMDLTNPEVYKLMKDLFNDIIDMCGKPLNFFHTNNDEWWHKCKVKPQVVYKGQTRQELFYKFLMEEYKIITRRGLKMSMFDDMLLQKHNGGLPFNLYKVAEKLPRDIIMLSWSESNQPLFDMGFKQTWKVDNGFSANFRKPCPADAGFGTIIYPFFGSMLNHSNTARWLHYCYHTTLQCGNYAWNKEEKGALPMAEWASQYMPNLMGTFGQQPNPAAGSKLVQLKIAGDCKLAKKLNINPETTVGNIPMKTTAMMVTPGKPFVHKFSPATKISSLYVLSAADPKDKAAIKKLQHEIRTKWKPYGVIAAKFVLQYADGSTAEMPLRLGRNFSLLKDIPAQSKFIKNARALHHLNPEHSKTLYQTEWINPCPKKPVKAFKVECTHSLVPVILSAVTIRDTKKN